MNQAVDIQERRSQSTVSTFRVIQKIGIQVNGRWVWQEFELSPAQAAAAVAGPLPQPRQLPARQAPAMTNGRDPGKYLITIGKNWQGLTIEAVAMEPQGMDELHDFAVWGRKQKDPSPSLEVLCEMIEAFLIEREFVPTPKYKSERRR